MAIPVVRSLNERYYNTYLADVSADTSAHVVIVGRGMLTEVWTVMSIAITAADAVITLKKNGTSISQTITLAASGAAVGTVDTLVLSPAIAVDQGDVIEFDSDGGSSTTAPVTFTLVVDEG